MLVVSGAYVTAKPIDKSTDEPGRASRGTAAKPGFDLSFDPETTNMKLVARPRESHWPESNAGVAAAFLPLDHLINSRFVCFPARLFLLITRV
jgi:hypothetical protein